MNIMYTLKMKNVLKWFIFFVILNIINILNIISLPLAANTLTEDKRVKDLKEVWHGNKTIDYDTAEKEETNTKNELLGIKTEQNDTQNSTQDSTTMEIVKKNELIKRNPTDSKIANTNYDKFQSSTEFNIVDEDPHAANIVLGEKLWKQHCTRCHNLRSTKDFDTNEWRAIMAHMKVRACLPDQLARIILEYIVYSAGDCPAEGSTVVSSVSVYTPEPSSSSAVSSSESKTVEYKTFSNDDNNEINEKNERNVNKTEKKSESKTEIKSEIKIDSKKETQEKTKGHTIIKEEKTTHGLPGPPP